MATKKIGYAAYRLSPLQKITAEAKKIRAKNPSMKWVDAVKKASKQYNAGSTAKPAAKPKPVAKSKPATKKVVKKVAKKKVAGIGEAGKRTAAVNNSIDQLRKYGELIRLENFLKKAIDYNLGKKKLTKDATVKKLIDDNTNQLRKQLAVVKKQKQLQKTLI